MLRNYRSIGTTNSSYLAALGSGASQGGGDVVMIPIVDKVRITMFSNFLERSESNGEDNEQNNRKA